MTPRFRHVMVAVGLFALANSSDAFLILQAHHAGVSAAMLPLLWAAHHVVKAIFSTHAGALSDRVGRRRLLVIGWGLYGVIYLLFPLAGSLAAFLALFLVYAIPFTLTDGAERALVGDVTPAQSRGRGFGIYYLTNGLGVLAGSVIFGLLSQSVSPLAAFTTGAVLAFAAATTIMLFKE